MMLQIAEHRETFTVDNERMRVTAITPCCSKIRTESVLDHGERYAVNQLTKFMVDHKCGKNND